jgi:FixJ family two-component response regulator
MNSIAISQESRMNSPHVFGHNLSTSVMTQVTPIVSIVESDDSMRESLELLVRCEAWQPRVFASAQDFFARPPAVVPNCLVLAVAPGGPDGLDVQKRVAIQRPEMPVIFIAGHADVRMTVEAMKAGAFEYLAKPFQEDALLDAIREALDRSRKALGHAADLQVLTERYGSLSPREHQVMKLVVAGVLNKNIGSELGISEITVKAHRGKVMLKMKADSLAELVRMATQLRMDALATA